MNIVKDYIFPENKLGSDQIEAIVSEASGSSIDLSDLYIQYTTVESWTCEDGIVKNETRKLILKNITILKNSISLNHRSHQLAIKKKLISYEKSTITSRKKIKEFNRSS